MATAKKTTTTKKAAAKGIEVAFEFDRDTKNTRRFAEVPESEFAEPLIGTLYVKKSALAEANGGALPESLTLTITPS